MPDAFRRVGFRQVLLARFQRRERESDATPKPWINIFKLTHCLCTFVPYLDTDQSGSLETKTCPTITAPVRKKLAPSFNTKPDSYHAILQGLFGQTAYGYLTNSKFTPPKVKNIESKKEATIRDHRNNLIARAERINAWNMSCQFKNLTISVRRRIIFGRISFSAIKICIFILLAHFRLAAFRFSSLKFKLQKKLLSKSHYYYF